MPIESPFRGHLLEDGLRSSGVPHEGFADPVTNDGIGFRSNMFLTSITIVTEVKMTHGVIICPLVLLRSHSWFCGHPPHKIYSTLYK